MHDKDCAKGLYCHGAITMNCGGECKRELRGPFVITQTLPNFTYCLLPVHVLTTAADKKDGERIKQSRPFHWDYDQCLGGDGACGYCSSKCDSDKGCSIVPMRMFHITSLFFFLFFFLHSTNPHPPLCVCIDLCPGGPCVHDKDCQEGLYCDGGKNFITANCDGVCLGELRTLVVTHAFPHFTYCYPCMFNRS